LIAVTLSVLLTPLFALLVWQAVESRAHRNRTQPARPIPLTAEPALRTRSDVTDYAEVSNR
jgi:hypothetical protein